MPALVMLVLVLAATNPVIDRARAALDHNDPDTAATLLEQAVAQEPTSAEAHYWLGVAYGEQAEKAIFFRQPSLARKTRAEFERAVELDPNHLDARYALVEYYVQAPSFLGGGLDKARAQAAEIAKRKPGYGHRAAAFIDMNQKDFKAAEAELEAALAIDPNDRDAAEMLKTIRERNRR